MIDNRPLYTWEDNVKNCRVDVKYSVIVTGDEFDSDYHTLAAGVVLGNLNIADDQYDMHHCGRWFWLVFKDMETAMAFKLKW